MECNFYVGQKVVCVDDSRDDYTGRIGYSMEIWDLVKDKIYTISQIEYSVHINSICLFLAEIPIRKNITKIINGVETEIRDGGYHHRRFRPLKETNIEIFKAMLNPSPETIKKFQEEEAFA